MPFAEARTALQGRSRLLLSILAVATAATLLSFQSTPRASVDSLAATYSHGTLRVDIPYDLPRAASGQLTVEALDPDNAVLAIATQRVTPAAPKGQWHEDLKLAKDLPLDDIAWDRIHYRFTYADAHSPAVEDTDAISQILRTPILHILGQSTYLAGGPAAVRVIVTDNKNQPIAGPATLRIELDPAKTRTSLFTGRLDGKGSAEAQFQFPAGLTGSYPVRYSVDTPIGAAEYTETIRLEDKVAILLTTEKPIYQPGQIVHVRALAEDRSNHAASAARALTFEIQDSRGNKVFRKSTQTSKFGIASAEFALADEVNLGAYHLKATLDSASTSEINFNVDRYVLPKFKVAVDFASANADAKHGYRPGDHVTGTIHANYFFGKPVDRAEVAIKATGMDVAQFDAASQNGRTDDSGDFHFDFTLPTYFAGRPLTQGAARVLVEATVKDSAGHSETRGEPIVVSQSPLVVTAIPEGGTLIPGLDNQVFILTSYADGKPAVTNVKVTNGGPEKDATTDEGGVAVISVTPKPGAGALRIEAADKQGNKTTATPVLEERNGLDQILLRTERAVYKPGDRIALRVFSTKQKGSAYIDILKDGQTVLTRDVDLVNGQADFAITATPAMSGTLDFDAYLFGADARAVGDHRLIFVEPSDELKIEASTDRPVYKPGDDAQLRFKVTNSRGESVAAALGVQIVDEAVFALAEKQPGFAKVFFYLEEEAMKPRYEIHSFGMTDVIAPQPERGVIGQRDRAARALFAATELAKPASFRQDYNPAAFLKNRETYDAKYRTAFENELKAFAKQYSAEYRNDREFPGLADAAKNVRDPWGEPVHIEPISWQRNTYLARSSGPDKRPNTPDDLMFYLRLHDSGGPSNIVAGIEPNRGPNNGLAEISGSVLDSGRTPIFNAQIFLKNATTDVRSTVSRPDGRFSFAALQPGQYSITVSAPDYETTNRTLNIHARDRAELTATLSDTVTASVVTVESMPRQQVFARGGLGGGGGGGVMRQFQMGVAAGAAGGVIGGIVGGVPSAAPPMPVAMMKADVRVQAEAMVLDGATLTTGSLSGSLQPAVHTRSYFPEALYINPELITDATGSATISIPLADSITTWRMALMASTTRGALGSGTGSIKVFQPFFADLDLPVTLTQGDQVSIPVAIYNYTGARGEVSLNLQPDPWYSLVNDSASKSVAVDSDHTGGSQFTIRANSIGKFKLTLSAKIPGTNHADIVVREIEVVPDGREQTQVFNGRLETSADAAIEFPPNAISGASKVLVRLYPGPLSQVIEGMDAILRMPYGCFEQTSSSTYPNVLALDYMKRTKKSTPEIVAKADGFISQGYQRLLTFEVPGGGFSWFGQPPANKILTAYGLMEFSDMAKVHDVDPALITRTQQWLASQQQPDGSWKPDTNFINEGATTRFNTDVLRISAYLAWSLENTGYRGPAIEKAKEYVDQHVAGNPDAYTLAVLANFAADYKNDRAFLNRAIESLLAAKHEEGEKVWWTSDQTGLYGGGDSGAVETTGLAVQALLKSGENSAIASKALAYISSKKDANGTWGSTQATIMALRAVLLSTENGAAEVRGDVEVALNGQPAEHLTLTADNDDLFHQFVLPNVDAKSDRISLRFTGKGRLAYQVVGRYFVPWTEKPAGEPLSIDVAYDRTHLSENDIATATATVKNNLNKQANMVMVDLGIPPGFDLLSEDLQDYVAKSAALESGRLEKFSQTATQAILYFDSIAPGGQFKVSFRLRAKYPIRTRAFESNVYEYYNPSVKSVAKPIAVEVKERR